MIMSLSRGMVACWDFRYGPCLSDRVVPERTLQPAGLGHVRWHADDVVGGSMAFTGDGGHLRLPPDDVGDLDMSRSGQVTVMALVRREALGRGFIAGLWQEKDSDPRRQYGMFIDLPAYGGGDQVIGHVSRTGGPSPRLPYSRDYAASARMVGLDAWRLIAFRYDGALVTAFLDGIADPRPDFVETGPPLGEGLRYAKNPFSFGDGLNSGPLAEFTIGAVRLSSGIGNAFRGRLSRLAVWDRALNDAEITACTAQWTPSSAALSSFDWWRADPPPNLASGGEDGRLWSLETAGARQTTGISTPVQVLPGRLVRNEASDDAVVALPLPPSAQRIHVDDISDLRRLQVSVSRENRCSVPAPPHSDGHWTVPPGTGATTLELCFEAGAPLSCGTVRLFV